MARPSLLLMPIFMITSLLAQDMAANEETAMLSPKSESCPPNMMQNRVSRIDTLEQKMGEILTDTSLGDFGAKAASAQPQIHSNRFFIKADGFLWKAFFGGSDYAATNASVVDPLIGDTKRADFSWRWGMRAELGYRLPHDHWDALANYTWFDDKAESSAVSPPNGTIVPLIPAFMAFAERARANIHWRVLYQNLDLDLRKAFFLSRHFSVSPFFGMRNTWLKHGYRANYINPEQSQWIKVLTRQDTWGIGPLAGMNSEWHFTNQWSVFGSFLGAVLASDYEIISIVLSNQTPNDHIKANTFRLSPTVQGSLGIGWQMNFNRQRNHIAARLSYEAQYGWRQNLTLDYTATYYPVSRQSEDLGFHGFTLDMLFDF